MKVQQEYIIPIVLLALYIRICISFAPHSGQGKRPLFGDYEAQRHWQELTVNLPVEHWYTNTTQNDLQYWGLDYPPLTALHSKLLGHIARSINTNWTDLFESRGEESYEHKVFMRATVLFSEILHLGPLFALLYPSNNLGALVLLAVTPAQPLIDHGHFQYNCISIGLTLCAVLALAKHRVCVGSALFTLALNYKQMSLYHALPFFFYILGPRYNSISGIKEIIKIGATVVLTFAVCWIPFISTAGDVVVRMFPFNRGLFEDKVANFWCSLSVLVKVRDMFERVTLVRMALFLTVLSVLPSQILLFRNATPAKFILALTNSALGFFLFSFHVHEKTILIPLATVLLLYPGGGKSSGNGGKSSGNGSGKSSGNGGKSSGKSSGNGGKSSSNGGGDVNLAAVWFQIIATFSMWPLLVKDGLPVMYLSGLGLYTTLVYVLCKHQDVRGVLMFVLSVVGCLVLHGLEVMVEPPARYPFLHQLLCALYSAAHFGGFFCYFNYLQIQ